jgi:alpha-beta hydrolase superfamily lysophospholipase
MDFLFTTSADGTRLRLGRVGAGSQDLLIVHGLAEHAERYSHVAKFFADQDYRVTIVELRGHGHSGGSRGHVFSWGDYRADLQAAAKMCKPDYQLLAHSMGGLVTMDSLREGLSPSKVVLSNPLLGVKVRAPRIKVAAAGLLSKVWPTLSLSNELDSKGLSRDQAIVDAYNNDPLVYNTLTPRWYTEMRAALERVRSATYTAKIGLFCSETDPITNATSAKELVVRAGGQVTEYPGMLHEILNEIGKEQVMADMLAFLKA